MVLKTNLKNLRYSPSAVIWDLDGVLADSSKLHFESWQETLVEFGINITYDQFLPYFGCTPASTLKGLLGDFYHKLDHSEVRYRKELRFNKIASNILPTPGVGSWLDFFSDICPQAVASSAPKIVIEFLLEEMKIRDYFGVIVSGSNLNGKPDPTVYLTASKILDVIPDRCLAIEDSPIGIKAARAANIPVIAICTTNSPENLQSANLIVPDLSQLTMEQFIKFCGDYLSV